MVSQLLHKALRGVVLALLSNKGFCEVSMAKILLQLGAERPWIAILVFLTCLQPT